MPDSTHSVRVPFEQHSSTTLPIPTPRFPKEICDLMIDSLGCLVISWGDNAHVALRECALVCWEWRPRAQFWFFRWIKVDCPSTLGDFLRTHDHGEAILARTHTIRVECGRWNNDQLLYPPYNPLTTFATPLSRRLSSLRTLNLHAYDHPRNGISQNTWLPEVPIHPHLLRLCTAFASISTLHISGVLFVNFWDLAHLLSCFTKLRTLILGYIRFSKARRMLIPGCMRKFSRDSTRKFLSNLTYLEVCIISFQAMIDHHSKCAT